MYNNKSLVFLTKQTYKLCYFAAVKYDNRNLPRI